MLNLHCFQGLIIIIAHDARKGGNRTHFSMILRKRIDLIANVKSRFLYYYAHYQPPVMGGKNATSLASPNGVSNDTRF